MVVDLRYFNSLKLEVDSLRSQLETQKTQFLNEIDRLSREYYYADHMNAILGVYSELYEDLKAQLQDKGIVISELKKLIDKQKGKSVDTKFEKSSVIRQPNAFKSQRPSVLGKPTTFSNSFVRKDFSKSTSVTQTSVSNDFSKPVTAQTMPSNKKSILKNTNVLAPGMYKIHTDHNQTRTSQLHQNSRKTNKCTLNVKSVSAMCDKCVLIDMHDMCVLNSDAKPIKRTIASESNQKPKNFTRKLYEHVSKTCSWWYSKFTPSGYKWKPKSGKENVNPNISMPIGNTSRTANFMDTMTSRRSTVSNNPLSSNSFEARRDCSRGTDLYSITLHDTICPNLICLMAKASSSQAWLWHRRLSHLNFDTINLLLKNDIVTLHAYFAAEGILHQTFVTRTPEQNGIVERLSAADAPFQRQTHTTPLNNHTTPAPSCQVPTLVATVSSSENINQAKTYAEND
nr:integrase, catalytic region, zinc finger, CCHC-type, peptidase aspartic, catalytic [Tanacetum cinerariifolium]